MVQNTCRFSLIPSGVPQTAVTAPVPAEPTLQEAFVSPGDASVIGLVLSQIRQQDSLLMWIQDRKAIREMGRMYLHGLPGREGPSVMHVTAKDGREALWAMLEGLKCTALGAVIGEIHGDPRALDFTATRRLAVAAERYGVPAFLVRVNGQPNLSGARRRWRVESRPSLPHQHDIKAPGAPVWSLDLFRARDIQPHRWDASYDRAAHRLDLVSPIPDEQMEEDYRQIG